MSSLHFTLIGLGVGLVAAMVLYNLYQERRSRRQAERLFGLDRSARGEDDSPGLTRVRPPGHLPESRIEPRIPLTDEQDEAPPGEMLEAGETAYEIEVGPVAEDAGVVAAARVLDEVPEAPEEAQQAALEPESPLDGAIEYVARLRYAQPTPLVFATLMDNLRRISKPIRLVGRCGDGTWEPVLAHASRAYDTVELALLLADRSGPVTEVQLDAFCRRLYEFAAEHGGAVSCQDKEDAFQRARTLDAFCAEVDMLIGLNVISPSGGDFPNRAIRDLAGRAGLVQGADGGYSLRDGQGRQSFTLTAHDDLSLTPDGTTSGVQGLSLLFDVPRVAGGLDAFDRMSRLGFEMAEHLGGQLVDDGGRAVSHQSLTKDRKRLEAIYERMAQWGIPAGGERALRLFA